MSHNRLETDMAFKCAELINQAESIAALTGAGISTNAGIPDFRGPKGLYVTRKYDPDKVFDIFSFHQDPKPFFDFARDFINLYETIQPTFTHRLLTELERRGKLKGIITQNIDALHQMGGSKQVYEIHGSFLKSTCLDCGCAFTLEEAKRKLFEEIVPRCDCGGIIKPDIVFFGENVKHLNEAADLAARVDLFFVIGTSCVVYPAAMLPSYVSGKIVVVNQTQTPLRLPNVVLTVKDEVDQFFRKVAEYV
ncbi:MAG TPA: Sir2 family NAD-dependent protein deacetylase [Candidatus Omnitrophota bacterium]|nr:Sir2 family NAD-dependent protein deacetylase [Candidatus Omnitrophota bacterium]